MKRRLRTLSPEGEDVQMRDSEGVVEEGGLELTDGRIRMVIDQEMKEEKTFRRRWLLWGS